MSLTENNTRMFEIGTISAEEIIDKLYQIKRAVLVAFKNVEAEIKTSALVLSSRINHRPDNDYFGFFTHICSSESHRKNCSLFKRRQY